MSFRQTLVVLEKDSNTIKVIRELAEALNLNPYFVLGERKMTMHFTKSEIAAIILSVDMPLKDPLHFMKQFAEFDEERKKWNVPVLLIHTGEDSRTLAEYVDFERTTTMRKPLIMSDLCTFLERNLGKNWIPEARIWQKKLRFYQAELNEFFGWSETVEPLIDHFEGQGE